jgi:hypothetical protein
MALRVSTGFRNGLLTGNNFYTMLNQGIVRLYSGTMGTNPDTGVAATALVTFEPLYFQTAATAGTIFNGTNAVNGTGAVDGTAGYFRLSEYADDPTVTSTTVARIDGVVNTSTGDMIMGDNLISIGQVLSLQIARFGFPVLAGTSGTSGT